MFSKKRFFLIIFISSFFSSFNLFTQEIFFKGEASYLIKVLNQKSYKLNSYPLDFIVLDSKGNCLDINSNLLLNKINFLNYYLLYNHLKIPLNIKWDFFPIKREGKVVGNILILNDISQEKKWEIIMESLVYIGYAD